MEKAIICKKSFSSDHKRILFIWRKEKISLFLTLRALFINVTTYDRSWKKKIIITKILNILMKYILILIDCRNNFAGLIVK